jgi:hypothetical protein
LLVFCGGSEIRTKASVAILMFLLPQENQTWCKLTAEMVVIVMVTNYGRLDEP